MRIVVTGARGFVGRAVLPLLLKMGHDVIAITSKSYNDVSKDVEWVQADLLDQVSVIRVMQQTRPEALLHLAWYTEHGKFWEAAENFEWALASIRLLDAMRAAGGRRIVIGGTCAEYDWSEGVCIEDQTQIAPHSVYGKAKDLTRHYAQAYSKRQDCNGLEVLWGRIFFPYGPGEPEGRLIPSVLKSLRGNDIVRCSHGKQMRDFIHVEDVASALVYLLTSDVNDGLGGIYNIASGEAQSVSGVINMLANYFPHHKTIEFGAVPSPSGDPPLVVGNIDKLLKMGWRPIVSMESGIRRYVEDRSTP